MLLWYYRKVKIVKKKYIKFKPFWKLFEHLESSPTPAVLKIPKWYKQMPNFINKDIKIPVLDGKSNATLKMCPPFLDSLSCGYTINLPFDLWVHKDSPGFKFFWETDAYPLVEGHTPLQYPGLDISKEFDENIYKFNTSHCIETPPGYSLLFTHPLNRVDLPFLSLSGIVDSDTFSILPINIPFLIKKDFYGMIEKGTPIAQIIPIKREPWGHEIEKYNFKNDFGLSILKSTMVRSYKNRWWNKKTYN